MPFYFVKKRNEKSQDQAEETATNIKANTSFNK